MKNLVHKIASSGGTVSRLNRATGLGCGRLGNFGRLAGPENRAVRHLGGCVSGVSPTRPTMLISCNNSGRFPLYGVDGNVRRMERNMNAMIRARSTMRQVTLAALGGRSLRLPGATAAGIGCQITGPGELFHHTLEFRPYSQQKAEHNHAPQPSDQSSTRN